MNWQNGLQRLSAVWWGFLAFIGLITALAGLINKDGVDHWALVGLGVAGMVACFIAHKITCWIVAGFFSPRS